MTSKISFINLRREHIKHRIGMILVTFFFFFLYMLTFLIVVQNICSEKDYAYKNLDRITDLSRPETGMGFLAVGAAVLLAISSFRYLHSKTEIDFYHSLPIKRRRLLYLMITNDFVLFVFPLVLVSLFKCIVAAAVGYFGGEFFVNTMWSILCYIAVFAVIYLTMSLAMIMTGNTFIGILGFCVFAGYSPIMLYWLYPSLASTFFATFCDTGKRSEIFKYFSPASLSDMLLTSYDGWNWKEHIGHLAVIAVWVAVLLVINYLLFERRPSEMAGRAMAFPAWNPIIRFLLVIPGAVYVGLALYTVSFTSFKPWIIAGIIIGGFFSHGVIECIYRFDVRGLWSNKRQMLAAMAVSFVIVGFFWADLGGYDQYLPKAEELASIGLEKSGGDSFWGKERNGVSGEAMEEELKVLEKIVSENNKNKAYNNSLDGYKGFEYYTVRYKLKNGNEVRRQYLTSAKLRDELMEKVFDTMEYKKDTYSLYTADWALVTDIQLTYPASMQTLDLTKEQRAGLFRSYLEDHSTLDYDTVRSTLPFGQIMIMHNYDTSALMEDNRYQNIAMEESDAYYLYPSFKKTIKYLKEELKVDLNTSMKDIQVTHLEASRYKEDSDTMESLDIYDEEFINSIKDRLCYGEEMWPDGIDVADTSVDLTATILTDTGEETCAVYTDSETLEKIKNKGTFE